MKVGDIFKTNAYTHTFIADSIVEITKINGIMINYKYIKTAEIITTDSNYFSQNVESFKKDAIPLTDLTKTLI